MEAASGRPAARYRCRHYCFALIAANGGAPKTLPAVQAVSDTTPPSRAWWMHELETKRIGKNNQHGVQGVDRGPQRAGGLLVISLETTYFDN